MFAESWQAGFLNWVLTYLLHSTILLGGVWMVSLLLSARLDAIKETLWKFALLGGILTATAQVGLQFEPLTGRLNLYSSRVEIPSVAENEFSAIPENADLPSMPSNVGATPDPGPATGGRNAGGTFPGQDALRGAILSDWEGLSLSTKFRRVIDRVIPLVSWALLGLIVMAMVSYLLSYFRLRRELAGRVILVGGRAGRLLEDLCHRSGVTSDIRLSCSERIASPVAMGIFKREICLPRRALDEMADVELEVMVAHELAHLVRRDPHWAVICHVMSTLLIIQPLNIIASRRLRELAEYQCDAWAAAHCGGALPLARCLTQVAAWLLQSRRMTTLQLVSGMSVHQSTLRKRVGRLLEEDWRLPSGATKNMVLLALTFVLGSVILLTPAVSAVSVQPAIVMMPRVDIPDSEPLEVPVFFPAAEPSLSIEPRYSEVSHPFAALDAELELLEEEVEGLRSILQGAPGEAEIFNLIDQFEQKIASIRDRQARLENALYERRPNTPGPVRRTRSRNPEPTHARRSP